MLHGPTVLVSVLLPTLFYSHGGNSSVWQAYMRWEPWTCSCGIPTTGVLFPEWWLSSNQEKGTRTHPDSERKLHLIPGLLKEVDHKGYAGPCSNMTSYKNQNYPKICKHNVMQAGCKLHTTNCTQFSNIKFNTCYNEEKTIEITKFPGS